MNSGYSLTNILYIYIYYIYRTQGFEGGHVVNLGTFKAIKSKIFVRSLHNFTKNNINQQYLIHFGNKFDARF